MRFAKLFRRLIGKRVPASKASVTVSDLEVRGPDAPFFRVSRGGVESRRVATAEEVDDFLDACGFPPGSSNALLAKAGVPFESDGAMMVLKAVPTQPKAV